MRIVGENDKLSVLVADNRLPRKIEGQIGRVIPPETLLITEMISGHLVHLNSLHVILLPPDQLLIIVVQI